MISSRATIQTFGTGPTYVRGHGAERRGLRVKRGGARNAAMRDRRGEKRDR